MITYPPDPPVFFAIASLHVVVALWFVRVERRRLFLVPSYHVVPDPPVVLHHRLTLPLLFFRLKGGGFCRSFLRCSTLHGPSLTIASPLHAMLFPLFLLFRG